MTRRVVITGLGPITAFGVGIDPLWSGMVEGRSAIRRISRFNPCGFPCKVAAELPDEAFDVKSVVPKSYRKATKVMCRDIELAMGAAAAAISDARLVTKAVDADASPTIPPDRFGCHIGAGLISADLNELTSALIVSRDPGGAVDLKSWGSAGMQNLSPLWLLKFLPNMLACHVTIVHDCRGPSNTITCCEASSALSVGESWRVIQRGAADACLSGGAEFKVNPMAYIRQHFAGRLATTRDDEDPSRIVAPFDPDARGTVNGEGGGIVVLEALECAQRRDATIYAEVAGFAATQSFCPDTLGLKPDPAGEDLAVAMETAMNKAGAAAGDVDAIVPFGSGIPHMDRAEAAAIKAVFGGRAAEIPLITTIPNAGNCNAGNGAVALCVAVKAMHEQTLPARLNTVSADGLDASAAPSRAAKLKTVLVVTTSQGGQNTAILLRKP
jgi:3-oxoacyl-[acyl-carrier-protein] synthase II